MEKALRDTLRRELRRRHGYGMMDSKIKPVHIANALMRAVHGRVGQLTDVEKLMVATAAREEASGRDGAVEQMVEQNRERWGRLGDKAQRRELRDKVLPLIRRLLATDAATFGSSPHHSSFSVPNARMCTRDPSDEHAGAFVLRLWSEPTSGSDQLIDIVRTLSNPDISGEEMDDLTAVLAPLCEGTREVAPRKWEAEDLADGSTSAVAQRLRVAAWNLALYENASKPSPIATLQRVVLLGSLSVFLHAATRASEHMARPAVPLLVDVSGARASAIADASQRLVSRVFEEARAHMEEVLVELIRGARKEAPNAPALDLAAQVIGASGKALRELELLAAEVAPDEPDMDRAIASRMLETLATSGRGSDAYIRLLGLRCGLLYPQQKTRLKRVLPVDRTLEVIVASTFDLTGRPLEYREFLDELEKQWGFVTGGRPEDSGLLERIGVPVSSHELAENGERFLDRLEAIGLAKRFADSVAMVGLMEVTHGT